MSCVRSIRRMESVLPRGNEDMHSSELMTEGLSTEEAATAAPPVPTTADSRLSNERRLSTKSPFATEDLEAYAEVSDFENETKP